MSSQKVTIALDVNGEQVESIVPVRLNLVDFLRGELGLTGSHVGCEHGVCGACTVLVDKAPARGCLMLAVQADCARVETIEGLSESGHDFGPARGLHRPQCAAMWLLHAGHAGERPCLSRRRQ